MPAADTSIKRMEVLVLIVLGWFVAAGCVLLFVRAMGAAAARADAAAVEEDRVAAERALPVPAPRRVA